MEIYFHIDHARKICIAAFLNLQTGKFWDFWEKIVYTVDINIIVLGQCCCEKNNITCLHIFFREFDHMAQGRSSN